MTGLIPHGRETNIAGALAESGAQTLELNGAELHARRTDLPAELAAAQAGAVLTTPAVRFVSEPDGWHWQCDDQELAAALTAIGG